MIENLNRLGLEPSKEIECIIDAAWQAQQHRSKQDIKRSRVYRDTFVSRPAVFFAACYCQKGLWQALEEAGLKKAVFLQTLGLANFKRDETSKKEDIEIHGLVMKGLEIYNEDFPNRCLADGWALAYGILKAGEERFLTYFRDAGGDPDTAIQRIKHYLS